MVSNRLDELIADTGGDQVDEDKTLYLAFEAAHRTFLTPLADVLAIIPTGPIAFVPSAPSWILGVLNSRGSIIPVVDLEDLLDLEVGTSQEENGYVAICLVPGVPSGVGFAVSDLKDIVEVADTDYRPPLSSRRGRALRYVTGCLNLGEEIAEILDLTGIGSEAGRR